MVGFVSQPVVALINRDLWCGDALQSCRLRVVVAAMGMNSRSEGV